MTSVYSLWSMCYALAMIKKYILFDFDGVIANSFEPAFETKKLICPLMTEEQYRGLFEGNINDWLTSDNSHTDQCRHDIEWFSVYLPRMKKDIDIFPGMKDVIVDLEKDYTLVIVSSTLTFPIEEFLTSHDLRNHFDWVMGNDVHKSKVEKIKMVFEKYNITAKDCVFVTDTLGDIREAEKTGVAAIAVSWGFNKHDTLLRGNPFRLVDTQKELLGGINDYFNQ